MSAISRVAVALVAGLVCTASSGCGLLNTRPLGDVPETPLLEVPGGAPRPTVLVRRARGGQSLGAAKDVVAASGLFSSVAHQEGLGQPVVATDYVLDVEVSEDMEVGWYSVVGAVTLGILPVVGSHEQELRLVVRDGQLRQLTEVRREGGGMQMFWIPFLPATLVAALLPSDDPDEWTFRPSRDEVLAERQRGGLLLSALVEAWEEVGFAPRRQAE